MRNKNKTALVAGATGVVGRNLLLRLIPDSDWDVIAISRRKPDIEGNYRHLSVDLLNRSDTKKKLLESLIPFHPEHLRVHIS